MRLNRNAVILLCALVLGITTGCASRGDWKSKLNKSIDIQKKSVLLSRDYIQGDDSKRNELGRNFLIVRDITKSIMKDTKSASSVQKEEINTYYKKLREEVLASAKEYSYLYSANPVKLEVLKEIINAGELDL